MKQRSELDREGLEKIIEELKTQMKADEIPAAIENLVYQKHQQELEDLLLALFESKAIELKEEILAMLEEKLQKTTAIEKQYGDKLKGIDALIETLPDGDEKNKLIKKRKSTEEDKKRELIETDLLYKKQEAQLTKDIQERCLDRENEAVERLQKDQLLEKRMIFHKYLPDSLVKDILNELTQEEERELADLREKLEADKKAKMEELLAA